VVAAHPEGCGPRGQAWIPGFAACRRLGGGRLICVFWLFRAWRSLGFPNFRGEGFVFLRLWGANCLRFRLADLPIIGHTDERLSGFP
jgi:hypothetical protein